MESEIKVSTSFEKFNKLINLDLSVANQMKVKKKQTYEKTTLSFVYKPGSSICVKVDAKEVAEKIGLKDHIGISYFPEEKWFMISGIYATDGVLYPIFYSKNEKKYRCYQKELFEKLTIAAGITFEGSVTTKSFHNVTIEEHPSLGKIALIKTNEG